MSATRLSFAGGRAALVLDPSGDLLAVEHADAPGVNYLSVPAAIGGWVDGRPLPWEPQRRRLDSDEIEIDLVAFGSDLQASVRHMLTPRWTSRIALRNIGQSAVVLDDLLLGFSPGELCEGWALAAGAEARYTVLPPDPGQPLLAGYLRVGAVGSVGSIGEAGLRWGPIRLGPGESYVLGWDWEWLASPAAAVLRHDGVVPWRQVLLVDEVAVVAADPDAALVGAGVTMLDGRYEIEGGRGRTPYQLHSARGLVEFELEWVDAPAEALPEIAEQLLSTRWTSAGVPDLGGLEQALVVQHALRAGGFGWADEADEALGLVVARLADDLAATPLAALVLCGEYERTGDPELLELAAAALAGVERAVPGIGLATLRVRLALLGAGRTAPEPLQPTGRTAADLELAIVRGDTERQAELVRSLGRRLGAGLPGRAVVLPPVAELAHLVSVFSLLDERIGARLVPEWGVSPQELSLRTLAEVLARLSLAPPGPGYGWVALTVDSP